MLENSTTGDGPFTVVNNGDFGQVMANTRSYQRFYVTFDASKCSPVYGSSNVVTPLSQSTLCILKY